MHRRRAGPQIVVDARRHRLGRRVADAGAALEAQSARQINLADQTVLQLLNRFLRRLGGPRLRAVLDDAVVALRSADELPAFPPIVRARLLHIHVLAHLHRPERDQCVPVMRRGDAHGIKGRIFEQLADVGVSLRLGKFEFLHLREPFAQDVFVNIADRLDGDIRDFGEQADVIEAALAHAANREPDAFVGANDPAAGAPSVKSAQHRETGSDLAAGGDELPTIDSVDL